MIRRYVFLGLTLVLVVAIIFLIIRGRRTEKQQEGRKLEVVQEEAPSRTRVLTPRDLKIIRSKMTLTKQSGGETVSKSAQHEVEIHNIGQAAYGRIQLNFEYIGPKGKAVAAKTFSIEKVFSPGGTVTLSGINMDSLPASIADFRVTVAWADLQGAP